MKIEFAFSLVDRFAFGTDTSSIDDSSLLTIDGGSILQHSQALDNPSIPYFDPLAANLSEDIQALSRDLETYQQRGVLQNNIDLPGQTNVYVPESLGSFGNTLNVLNPLYSAQSDSNAHASGLFGYSDSVSMNGVSAPSLTVAGNPVVTQNPGELLTHPLKLIRS